MKETRSESTDPDTNLQKKMTAALIFVQIAMLAGHKDSKFKQNFFLLKYAQREKK